MERVCGEVYPWKEVLRRELGTVWASDRRGDPDQSGHLPVSFLSLGLGQEPLVGQNSQNTPSVCTLGFRDDMKSRQEVGPSLVPVEIGWGRTFPVARVRLVSDLKLGE